MIRILLGSKSMFCKGRLSVSVESCILRVNVESLVIIGGLNVLNIEKVRFMCS